MSQRLAVTIGKKLYPHTPVLGDIRMTVEPKQFVSILGPSGCGKTTLLRLIAGLDTEYQGEILLGDTPIRGPQENIGIVFQEPRLLPWFSVQRNVQFGIVESKRHPKTAKEIRTLLHALELQDFADAYPHQLSGGMAQKAALARALINLPDLLLLDEPLASLDALTKMHVQSELSSVLREKGVTALMVTHDIEEAVYLSDTILVMSKRPATILQSFAIDIPRPRNRASEAFLEVHKQVLRFMRDELDLFS
jgi:ABC-type nitrate/sulfonate/bicarbonate transport system ATPase subunit